jgi:hypothetical protein
MVGRLDERDRELAAHLRLRPPFGLAFGVSQRTV